MFSATIQLPLTSCNSRPFQITLVSARDSTTHIPHRSPVYRLDVGERHGLYAIVVPSLGFWSTDPSAERTSLVQINGRGGKKTDHAQSICGTFQNRWSRASQMLRYRRRGYRYIYAQSSLPDSLKNPSSPTPMRCHGSNPLMYALISFTQDRKSVV